MDIAIVSAGIRFPEAESLPHFWQHILAGRDLSSPVSPDRWPLEARALRERDQGRDQITHDKVYEVRNWRVQADGLALDPHLLETLDPQFHLLLGAGRDAWQAVAGREAFDPARCGIVLGNIALPTRASAQRAYQSLRAQLRNTRFEPGPFSQDPRNNEAAAAPAHILAAAFGWSGPAFTLDAACASSLYAIKLAAESLERGELDLVLAGGLSCPFSLYTQIGFSALQALSKSGRCQALDAAADGLMVGEGAGLFALQRLKDAEASGQKIWGVIRGVGLSNDREGRLMAPSSEGQLRAMRAAYEEAGWRPESVDLVACHATGTPIGDATELESLLTLFADTRRNQAPVILSSVKANVGHMLTAAGAASLAAVLMAFHEQVLPPTANFHKAPDALSGSALRVLSAGEPWPAPLGHARRAAISGFGFGGINAHLLIEAYEPPSAAAVKEPPHPAVQRPRATRRVAVIGLDTWGPERLDQGLALGDGSWTRPQFAIGYQQYRIPPNELRESLPQQVFALDLLRALDLPALDDALLARSACLVGIELDAMSNLYACRWALEGDRPRSLRDAAFSRLQDELSPPLDANRVIGALGSICASRVAREARFGGPAYTLSSGPSSGLLALQIGHRAIVSGEIEMALVLAVDVLSSHRAREQLREKFPDGSVRGSDCASGFLLMAEDRARALGLMPLFILDDVSWDSEKAPAAAAGAPTVHGGAAAGLHRFAAALRSSEEEGIFRYPREEGGSWKLCFSHSLARQRAALKAPRVQEPTRAYVIERRDLVIEPWLAAARRSSTFPIAAGASAARHKESAMSAGEARIISQKAADAGKASLSPLSSAATHRVGEGQRADEARAVAPSEALVPPGLESSPAAPLPLGDREAILSELFAGERQHAAAHEEFLRYRIEGDRLAAALVAQLLGDDGSALYDDSRPDEPAQTPSASRGGGEVLLSPSTPHRWVGEPFSKEPPLFDYEACREFARGRVASVFGPSFAAIDLLPQRVRLPDERLLLCHRVMAIEGEAMSLGKGRMVTEHDVHADAWYLEGGRMPTAIAVESGQADLMLAAYLGADFKTQGRAVYRLLDAKVRFHRHLPEVGETIRYAIEIKRFFEQGGTLFFHFAFEASIAGRPLMSMQDGCAGFFSEEALASGRGIMRSQLQLAPRKGRVTGGFRPWVAALPASLSDRELDALRSGDYAAAFGAAFGGLRLKRAKGLPSDAMRLVHRIVSMQAGGGRYQLGRIVGEADIHPDDWFLTCHFVGDEVMPGTLMYECCLHTLRVLLMSMGWVGEEEDLHFEPMQGILSQLKCRGQVLASTQKVRYDIEIKEIGYDPEPYVICDALMSADGKDIVDIGDMSLRLPGLDAAYFERLWQGAETSRPAYDAAQILAFAAGRPSDCFGPVYEVFDVARKIARLPRPPYQFLDRIEWIDGPFMEQHVGTRLRAAYDAPQDAWYWRADGNGLMPLAVLVEIALQPCGFMAAYMGSALQSSRDLSFRNLSGSARQLRSLAPSCGTLLIDVTCTKISRSGDMIIQDYSFCVSDGEGTVYEGVTSFGFFLKEALLAQVGIRGLSPWEGVRSIEMIYPTAPSLARAPLLMVDKMGRENAPAGRYEQGVLYGYKKVRADEWFFDAHFYEDPVMPGSLGLQALEQLLRAEANRIWPESSAWGLEEGSAHTWTYRGQVIPEAQELHSAVHIKAIDLDARTIRADGWLYCDGRAIYAFEDIKLAPVTKESKR